MKAVLRALAVSMSCLAALAPAGAGAETLIRFKRVQLNDQFYAEGATLGDINKDGKADVISGPFWYEGPDWQKKHAFYEPKVFDINGYSDNFFAYAHDLDGDGWQDILILGFPGKEARWYKNPGSFTSDTSWEMHVVADVVDDESPVFTDITGDGKPEIVCCTGGKFGWFAPNWEKPAEKWPFHAVTPDLKVARFTHGMGVGDVNGDGRLDLLEARRWWEAKDGEFTQHTFAAGVQGGAQMFAYDFDGDGRNDIVTSLAAHRYGVAVFMNRAGGDGPQWERRMLAGEQPYDSDYGIVFSQPHAMTLADVNGDGLMDIITGKRYWAHNGHDPDERSARVVYWWETRRSAEGKVDFLPRLIDANSGVGVDIQNGDANGDGLVDFVVGNKAGVYVLLQEREEISSARAQILEPKKMYGDAVKSQKDYLVGTPTANAAANMQVPGGFSVDLLAGEPDLVQPIAFTFDESGRIWVVEGMTYPKRAPEGKGRDRILIFEDADGDGSYEKRKVFTEGLNLASGIELGFGGVWVGAAPYLLFIPDKDKDDVPDGKPVVLLDGWGYQDTHETLNSFIWGPDGWLYGVQGVFTHSKVGKPGAPDEERTPLNCCVWRYHPVRHTFEVFAHGTSNPWGLDYDQHGEFFITACVIPHLFHMVPGGRYIRQGGQHFNPYTYDVLNTIADHAHYSGDIRANAHWGPAHDMHNQPVAEDTNVLGGGHAHCGLAIYNGDNFPGSYRGKLIFANLHGHRLVTDYIDVNRSTYTGKHGSDLLRSNDHWFMSVTQKVGPDGALYFTDWQDKTTCHHPTPEWWDQTNGRLYRLKYDGWKPWKGDLGKEDDIALANLATRSANEWQARMARRLLMERTADKMINTDIVIKSAGEELSKMWLLHNIGVGMYYLNKDIPEQPIPRREIVALGSKTPEVRAWAVRLLGEWWSGQSEANDLDHEIEKTEYTWIAKDTVGARLAALEKTAADSSPIVRRELASLLQRLPNAQRADIGLALIKRGEDNEDPYIPLLVWYGIEPAVAADPALGMKLAKASKLEKVTGFIYRRISGTEQGRAVVLASLAKEPDAGKREAMLDLVLPATRSAGDVSMPKDWAGISAKLREGAAPGALAKLDELSALFGDKDAIAQFRDTLADAGQPAPRREQALAVLVHVRDAGAMKVLHQVLREEKIPAGLRRKAIQALAALGDPEAPFVLTGLLPRLSDTERPDAVAALASSAEGAKSLLGAIGDKKVPATVLSPFLVRQLQALKNGEVDKLIDQVWGAANTAKADLPQLKAKYAALLTPDKLKAAKSAEGKFIFMSTCGTCHKLNGEGVSVGPDLTGSNRGDLNYLLENVLDPNALIGKDYQLNLFTMKDGRVMGGIVREENDSNYKIAMPGGIELMLAKAEIKKREISRVSTMPEGIFDALQPEQVVNLVAYLQTGAPSAAATAKASDRPAAPPAAKATSVPGALEGEAMKYKASGGNPRTQSMTRFSASQWSGGAHLWWTGAKNGDKLSVSFTAAKSGPQEVLAVLTKAPDYGIVSLAVDGQPSKLGEVDLYDPKVVNTPELSLGEFDLPAGGHTLEVTIQGANPNAKPARMFGLDYLRLK